MMEARKKLNKQWIIKYKKDQLISMFYIKIYRQVIALHMYLVAMIGEGMLKINYYRKYKNISNTRMNKLWNNY